MHKSDALEVAKAYVEAVEAKDREGVERRLMADVRQIFPMGSGGWEGLAVVYEGKQEVLDYTYGLFDTFERIAWGRKDWTVSADGTRIFLQAKGDMIVAKTGASYRNTYVQRYDVTEGKITQILEYAIGELFAEVGVEPSEVRRRGKERAHGLGVDGTYFRDATDQRDA